MCIQAANIRGKQPPPCNLVVLESGSLEWTWKLFTSLGLGWPTLYELVFPWLKNLPEANHPVLDYYVC
jgi:hypothetical protein